MQRTLIDIAELIDGTVREACAREERYRYAAALAAFAQPENYEHETRRALFVRKHITSGTRLSPSQRLLKDEYLPGEASDMRNYRKLLFEARQLAAQRFDHAALFYNMQRMADLLISAGYGSMLIESQADPQALLKELEPYCAEAIRSVFHPEREPPGERVARFSLAAKRLIIRQEDNLAQLTPPETLQALQIIIERLARSIWDDSEAMGYAGKNLSRFEQKLLKEIFLGSSFSSFNAALGMFRINSCIARPPL